MLRRKYQETIDKLVQGCKQFYGARLVSVVVYGSVGRGTPNPYSDIDTLIVATDLARGRLARNQEFEEVERQLQPWLEELRKQHGIHTCLSPIIKTPDEVLEGSWLFLDMVHDAKILFDRDRFFQTYLEQLAQELRDMGAQRVSQGQRWHWVLKPDYRRGEVIDL